MYIDPLATKMLIEEINTAFADVQLGDGVGVFEAGAIDDYAPEEERRTARAKDRASWDRWQDIHREVLERAYWTFNYTDAEGMRFLLPAYMTFAIQNYKASLFSIDALISGFNRVDAGILSSGQKRATARFLRFMAYDVGPEWVEAEIAATMYERFWARFDI